MEIASTLTDMIEAAGLGGEYQVHAGCGQGLLLRRTHRRRLRSGAPMQSRASPRRARRSWFGLAAVLGAGQLAAMPCAGSVHEPAPGINKISASGRRRVAPAGADGRSRRAAGGLAARDRFIAGREAWPKLLLWVLGEPKLSSMSRVGRYLRPSRGVTGGPLGLLTLGATADVRGVIGRGQIVQSLRAA